MDTMNYRQRFMNTMLFKDTKNVPFHEIALWQQTLERWKKEGLPEDATNGDFFEGNSYFGFEPREFIKINSNAPIPLFEYKVLEEDERTILYVDILVCVNICQPSFPEFKPLAFSRKNSELQPLSHQKFALFPQPIGQQSL